MDNTGLSMLKQENQMIKEEIKKICLEYSDYRIECEEICKEYEETIQLLTTSMDNFKIEAEKNSTEKNKLKADNEKLIKEIDKLREKNKDKIKDIEILNNELSQLKSKCRSSNMQQSNLKSKVVTLETDNDHYLNKIHQYEEEVTDLKDTLENTIENLITTQTEFEDYKIKMEENLQRLREELQEEKDNVNALTKKEKKINKNGNINNKKKIIIEEIQDKKNDEEEDIGKTSFNRYSILQNYNNIKMEDDDNEEEEKENECDRRKLRYRAFTMKRSSKINYDSFVANLRKRRDELVQLNFHLKKNMTFIQH